MTRQNSLRAHHHNSHRWNDRWNLFLASHHEWWSRRSDGCEQVYCLPDRVLGSLCDSHPPLNTRAHRRPRLISESDEAHERAFIDLCRQWDECVIGVTSRGEVLRFNLLAMDLAIWRPSSRRSTDNVVRMFDKGRHENLAIEQSQMVHVARVIQQSEYWIELKAIRARWRDLQKNLPFHIISGRLIPLDTWGNETQQCRFASHAEADFLMGLWEFANRWEIAAFLTWDIPIPRGRFWHLPGDPRRTLRLRTDSTFSLPQFIPPSRLYGDQKIIWQRPTSTLLGHTDSERVRCRQKSVMKHHQILKAFFAELATRSRFGGILPHGAKARLLEGLAAQLGKDSGHLKRLIKALRPAF